MFRSFSLRSLTFSAMLAALYVVLTLVSSAFGLDRYAVQFRLSEALTILPIFTASAIPGLTIGCILANVVGMMPIWDVIFGSLATLLGAIGGYCFRKIPVLAMSMPVFANALIVPLVLRYAYHIEEAYWYMVATVALGEVVMCMIVGGLLYAYLKRQPRLLALLPMSKPKKK